MKTKFIKPIVTSLVAFCLAFSPIAVFADNCSTEVCSGNYPESVKSACGCDTSNTNTLPNVIVNILNGVIAVAGVIAVVFVIVGGVQYMTSSGDANKVKKAKDTILYAIIGLIVCVLSFAIVNFVIVKFLK